MLTIRSILHVKPESRFYVCRVLTSILTLSNFVYKGTKTPHNKTAIIPLYLFEITLNILGPNNN